MSVHSFLLLASGLDKAAWLQYRKVMGEAHYPVIHPSQEPLYRAHFSQKLHMTSPNADLGGLIASMDVAASQTYDNKPIFDRFEIWATPDNKARILLGVAAIGDLALYFRVAEENKEKNATPLAMMRKANRKQRMGAQLKHYSAKPKQRFKQYWQLAGALTCITALSVLVFGQNWNW